VYESSMCVYVVEGIVFSEGFVRGIYVGWVGLGGDCVGKCVCYVGLLIFCKIFHH
jgi:hypothetical protein